MATTDPSDHNRDPGPSTEPEPSDPIGPDAIAEAAERFRADVASVRDSIARVIVGQTEIVDGVLTALFSGGHVLLEGVPGVGKTLLVRALAASLSLDFGRVQFTPDLMPADITGTTVVNEIEDEHGRTRREFAFRPGPIFCQILLADEINRATPKTQAALLEAMAERSVTVGGTTHTLPAPFFVLATQNPIEQEGTYPLPEAQLDRFFFKLLVRAPSREELREVLARTTSGASAEPTPVLDADRLAAAQRLVRRVAAPEPVVDYAVRLVLATHPSGSADGAGFATPMVDRFVRFGASPRAAQTLVLAAKVRALLDGRAAIAVDDVARAAAPGLRHRLVMNFEAEADGVTPDAVVANLVETLPRQAS